MPGGDDLRRALEGTLSGDREASRQLFALLYDELRGLAAHHLRAERGGHSLQPTALVHEAWLKLGQQRLLPEGGRAHFLSVASGAMRRILIDHFREKNREKRGGGRDRVTLQGIPDGQETAPDVDLLGLDTALDALAAVSARQAKVVELRFFGGLEEADIAQVLEVSVSTVQREWRIARAWLGAHLEDGT